ncbi:hypothetical protein EYF80_021026 [Liparis tanakae]|uniref:Uncharacterized protein n=1 Tax=Liparis tanakae TaxID=230148 RepID=A0A4Z2HUM3_9TELE|nr:hypothetical protein EYF80_021026 [Liparis tanakae]
MKYPLCHAKWFASSSLCRQRTSRRPGSKVSRTEAPFSHLHAPSGAPQSLPPALATTAPPPPPLPRQQAVARASDPLTPPQLLSRRTAHNPPARSRDQGGHRRESDVNKAAALSLCPLSISQRGGEEERRKGEETRKWEQMTRREGEGKIENTDRR